MDGSFALLLLALAEDAPMSASEQRLAACGLDDVQEAISATVID